jgi:ribose transport system ATP-binding protein
MSGELIRATKIKKSFSNVAALAGVDFDLQAGEVHALLGENGSGKSTLVKIFSGVYTRDSGDLYIKGKKVDNLSPKEAQAIGVGCIFQELNLCPHLTVAENIFLSRERCVAGVLNDRQANAEAKELLAKLNVPIGPGDLVRRLSVSKQQMVEICKTLSMNADIIIMDEPTSALSEKEINDLFRVIEVLKAQGKGIIYISHRLEELSKIVDRVTILRDGQFVKTMNFADTSLPAIIGLMVGRTLDEKFPRIESRKGEKVFEVRHLTTQTGVKDVSFELNRGEIVAFAGLVGAGRTELVRAVFGADRKTSGEVFLNGRLLRIRGPRDAIAAGIFCVPEDRKKDGLCVKMSVSENLTLPNLDLVSRKSGVVSRRREISQSGRMIDGLRIKTPNIHQYVRNLSGGNQQKIVVGKWLMREAHVVMFDEPTRGIDVAAKIEIYNIMNELKKNGIGVAFVSSELPEVMGMSDRVLVMCGGQIKADLRTLETSQEEILYYATQYA